MPSAADRFSRSTKWRIYSVASFDRGAAIGSACLYTLILFMPAVTDHLRKPLFGTPAE